MGKIFSLLITMCVFFNSCSIQKDFILWYPYDIGVLIKVGHYYSIASQEVYVKNNFCGTEGPYDVVKVLSFDRRNRHETTIIYFDVNLLARPEYICEVDTLVLDSCRKDTQLYYFIEENYPRLVYDCD
jgi:hypothetical protein